MKEQFTAVQVSKVLDQALLYQCACPAQVCRAIFELRELYEYQKNCGNAAEQDRQVHERIALATERAHAEMEACLERVLEIEGWDRATLEMPQRLRKKPARPL
jgi:hypothetical protein